MHMELQRKTCKAKASPRPDFRRAADFTLVPSGFWMKFGGDGVGAEGGSVLFEHVLLFFEFVFNIS